MPAIQPYIIEPIWEQFSALLPERKTDHPLGCHRSRTSDRVVFEKLVQVLIFGCAYEKIADQSCSATTLRRRRDEWIDAGVMERLREMVLDGYDRVIGLALSDVAVDCCITKAPCGGETAGRSPVDRGKRGIKRSVVVDANGIPLGAIAAPANHHDSPLLDRTLDTMEVLGEVPEKMSVHPDRDLPNAVEVPNSHHRLIRFGPEIFIHLCVPVKFAVCAEEVLSGAGVSMQVTSSPSSSAHSSHG